MSPPIALKKNGEAALRGDTRQDTVAPTQVVPPLRLWWLAAGFGVWCSALVALYALHAIGCTFAWPSNTLRLGLVVVLLVHLVVIGWMWGHLLVKPEPERELGPTGNFLRSAAVWTVISAFVATVVTLGPPLLLNTCN